MGARKNRKKNKTKSNATRTHQGCAPKVELSAGSSSSAGVCQPCGCGEFEAQIRHFVTKGSYSIALEKAKVYHKDTGTQASETILIYAYVARIRAMMDKGLLGDAAALLELVQKRYPAARGQLDILNAVIAARTGQIDELVRPLTKPNLLPEEKRGIEDVIKRELTDLSALASCHVLAQDHPLRTGATAAAQAFFAVTTRPVTDEEISLQCIARKSPLAPWKMVILALDRFYKYDDDACEKFLAAVDPESAPARLGKIIRTMLLGKVAAEANPAPNPRLGQLFKGVMGDTAAIRSALKKFDQTIPTGFHYKPQALSLMREVGSVFDQNCPDMLEKLKQHIFVKAWINEVQVNEHLQSTLGGPALMNAYLWLQLARAAETTQNLYWACCFLEEFRQHAIHENWFADNGQDVSSLYCYMANLLERLPRHQLIAGRRRFEFNYCGLASFYEGQPESIKRVFSAKVPGKRETFFLYPEDLYERATKAYSCHETFSRWLGWVKGDKVGWKRADEVALAWHKALPKDPRPLLFLVESSECRSAFKKSLGYLTQAEQIDGINPEVRKARLRLLVATAIRHMKQQKVHLVLQDIEQIEMLPQAREKDRPAFIEALKCVCLLIQKDSAGFEIRNKELTRLLEGPVAAALVVTGLIEACTLSFAVRFPELDREDDSKGRDLVLSIARGLALGDDMNVPFRIPMEFRLKIEAFFAALIPAFDFDPAVIHTIAQAALRQENMQLAYAAANAVLCRTGANTTETARFLLVRARSLPLWEKNRRVDCISAAVELARKQRDNDLLDEAIELGREMSRHVPFFRNFAGESMAPDLLEKIVLRERQIQNYPSSSMGIHQSDYFNSDQFDEDDELLDYDCDCDDDYDEYTGPLPEEFRSLPPSVLVQLMKLVVKHMSSNGGLPSFSEVCRKDPVGVRKLEAAMRSEGLLADDEVFGPEGPNLPSFFGTPRKSEPKGQETGRTGRR